MTMTIFFLILFKVRGKSLNLALDHGKIWILAMVLVKKLPSYTVNGHTHGQKLLTS